MKFWTTLNQASHGVALNKLGGAVIGDHSEVFQRTSYVYETIYGHKKVCHN